MATQKPILIAGAGISSLAFAQGLLKLAAHLPFRIFERDPALNVRSQGYRVRINPVGTTALKTVLPPHLYARLQGSCAILNKDEKPLVGGQGPVMHLDAITGEEMEFHFHGKGGPPAPRMPDGETLNADRTVLRSVLASGLESRIEFGKVVSGFETRPEGVILRFSDGTQVEGCLLVGADGTKSKIRQQLLPGYDFVDTEGRWFYGKTTLTPELEATFNKHCLKGLALVQDKTRDIPFSLLLEPIRFKDNEFRADLPPNYIYWVLQGRKDHYDLDDPELLSLSPIECAKMTQDLTSHWHPSLHPLFEEQVIGQTSILRIESSLPEIRSLDEKERGMVTLIGDSIHAMSPTAVVGAVTALRDAADLAQVLAEDGLKVESLGKYEGAMREYAGEAIRNSARGGMMLFGMRPFEELKLAV